MTASQVDYILVVVDRLSKMAHFLSMQARHIVALKSIYPLLSLHCTKIPSCGCAERWWALLKVCRAGILT